MRTALDPAAGAAKCRLREEWNLCVPWCTLCCLLWARISICVVSQIRERLQLGADLKKMNCEHHWQPHKEEVFLLLWRSCRYLSLEWLQIIQATEQGLKEVLVATVIISGGCDIAYYWVMLPSSSETGKVGIN